MSSIDDLKEEITTHFNEILETANETLDDICELVKDMWRTLDDEEVECQEKIKRIERARDERVSIMTSLTQ